MLKLAIIFLFACGLENLTLALKLVMRKTDLLDDTSYPLTTKQSDKPGLILLDKSTK